MNIKTEIKELWDILLWYCGRYENDNTNAIPLPGGKRTKKNEKERRAWEDTMRYTHDGGHVKWRRQ